MKDFYNDGHLLIGITGAAYAITSAEIISYLQKNICKNIRIITTESSNDFINLNAINYLVEDLDDVNVKHLTLTNWADIFIILPATANTISKVACGIADNELTASILAATCPVIFYPSMNMRMWENSILQENIQKLELHGYNLSYIFESKFALYNKSGNEIGVVPDLSRINEDIIMALQRAKD